ncbi:MAG: hypothetical protein MJY47_08640 [Fibrobacter sp.]|nr:hypothetical protein [Fibrobacter sp.]
MLLIVFAPGASVVVFHIHVGAEGHYPVKGPVLLYIGKRNTRLADYSPDWSVFRCCAAQRSDPAKACNIPGVGIAERGHDWIGIV